MAEPFRGPYRPHGDHYIEAGDNHIIARVERDAFKSFDETRATQALLAKAPELRDRLLDLLANGSEPEHRHDLATADSPCPACTAFDQKRRAKQRARDLLREMGVLP